MDTGLRTPPTSAAWEAALAGPLEGRAVTRVICTHMHPDHIGLAGMKVIATAAGVPDRVLGPVMCAYEAPWRLCVEGVLGPAWQPRRGILPGCPAAVFMMAIALYPLRAALAGEGCHARLYADDLTCWALRSGDEVQRVLRTAEASLQAIDRDVGWPLNRRTFCLHPRGA